MGDRGWELGRGEGGGEGDERRKAEPVWIQHWPEGGQQVAGVRPPRGRRLGGLAVGADWTGVPVARMPSMKPRGHKGGAHCGSKGVAREFERLTVSRRDSPIRHPSRNRTIRPGQLQKASPSKTLSLRRIRAPAHPVALCCS